MARTKEYENTLAFLKMAAIELRKIAERNSDVAAEVLGVAAKIEAEAAEIEKRTG